LVRHGVPFDVAFEIDGTTRTAWSIICSEQTSNKRYNFATRTFESDE